jgi:hypothetical protein
VLRAERPGIGTECVQPGPVPLRRNVASGINHQALGADVREARSVAELVTLAGGKQAVVWESGECQAAVGQVSVSCPTFSGQGNYGYFTLRPGCSDTRP